MSILVFRIIAFTLFMLSKMKTVGPDGRPGPRGEDSRLISRGGPNRILLLLFPGKGEKRKEQHDRYL
jgi:hypothetical protein